MIRKCTFAVMTKYKKPGNLHRRGAEYAETRGVKKINLFFFSAQLCTSAPLHLCVE